MIRERKRIVLECDVAVIGGGLSGVCAALAAARHGTDTVIIQNRPVFGGNASSEVRMHICGANCHARKPDLAETGILEELLLANKAVNHNFSFSVWDLVIWSRIRQQKGLRYFLNTTLDEVTTDDGRIVSAVCRQSTTERIYEVRAKIFIDATGNATLGYYSGADFRMGSEARSEYGEPHAPEKGDNHTMGNTILFTAQDMGENMSFRAPDWAYKFTEADLVGRAHGNTTRDHGKNGIREEYSAASGYWWIELGGDSGDIIDHAEEINDDLHRSLIGVWDHLKNAGEHGAENYELNWIGAVPGIRESRRLIGDYVLTEHDVLANRRFPDAVAYGGWPMDIHPPKGLFDPAPPTNYIPFDGVYTIPYRCYYSRNVKNLMMAGRDISTGKMAFGSVRVMGTCAIGGQAVGTAAALAVRHGCDPAGIADHIGELQQTLLKDDCYIPGIRNTDEADFARSAVEISAGSWKAGFEPENVVSGVARAEDGKSHCYVSDGIRPGGETLTLRFGQTRRFTEIRAVFDPNLNAEIMVSMTRKVQEREVKGMPPELVKDFSVEIRSGGKAVWFHCVKDNISRLCILPVPEGISGDELRVTVTATYGCPDVRIFEIRAY